MKDNFFTQVYVGFFVLTLVMLFIGIPLIEIFFGDNFKEIMWNLEDNRTQPVDIFRLFNGWNYISLK